MGWTTFYITGRHDFQEEVGKRLEQSDLNLMPGYAGSSTGDPNLASDLYWVDEDITLREFKEAIGSKLIWKYRLKFYTSLEAFIESQNSKKTSDFTPEERALLAEMQASDYRRAS